MNREPVFWQVLVGSKIKCQETDQSWLDQDKREYCMAQRNVLLARDNWQFGGLEGGGLSPRTQDPELRIQDQPQCTECSMGAAEQMTGHRTTNVTHGQKTMPNQVWSLSCARPQNPRNISATHLFRLQKWENYKGLESAKVFFIFT